MTAKKYTARGFRVYYEDAEDAAKNQGLYVVQSSCVAAGDEEYDVYPVRIYGGIDADGHVHLSREQAEKVRNALNTYLQEAEQGG